MPIINKFNVDQKVSSYLAFLFLLVISFLVTWFIINKAEKIVEDAANSQTFDMDKRAMIDAKNTKK
ncbi:MAG TPA: hypothetical protein PLK35_00880 [Candidatus Moranbacteria bacterium]|nr:hypothetical protein [Candidatus Moranbacteria bacterium]